MVEVTAEEITARVKLYNQVKALIKRRDMLDAEIKAPKTLLKKREKVDAAIKALQAQIDKKGY